MNYLSIMQSADEDGAAGQRPLYYGTALFASLLCLVLAFAAPQASDVFSLSVRQLFFLKGTIALPYIATWFFAAYGLSALDRYVTEAKAESPAVLTLLRCFRNGLLWLAAGTVCVALVGAIKSFLPVNSSSVSLATIVTNYLYVLPQLVGFLVICRGAILLQSSPEMSGHRHGGYFLSVLLTAVVASFYLFLFYTNPARQFSADPNVLPTYYLPDAAVLLTVVVPIVASWWLGFLSAFMMSDLVPYLTRPGLFQGISRILYGVWSIVFASIVVQALLSIGTARLYSIGLGPLLMVVYFFVLLQALGYFLVAFGVNSLQKSVCESA